jgi:7-keto-8-aminopelargonate synthetase-like enzyme
MMSSENNLKDRVEFDDSVLKNIGYNPYYLSINSEQSDMITVNGRKMINLATNNYLGLSNDERIKSAYIEAIKKYGISMCATPIAGGYTELFDTTQKKLSGFIGVENVLVYPSCYQANNGIFQAVARKEDLILFDRFSHSSLIQGIKSVGCKMLTFSHNDVECLEYLLNKSKEYAKVFVVTESVFSTEGAIAPFREIYDLCKKYNAIPVVDDSHGIGVIGKNGRGILSFSGIENYEGIYTSSLGKALVNNCGVVGGCKELISYLSFFSSHLIYSTAVSPAVLAGINRTLEIVEEEYDSLAKTIYTYSQEIKSSLIENGFKVSDSKAPINSIIAGTSDKTVDLAKKLFLKDVLSTPFIFPSVPKNDGRIRLIAGANLKESTIDRVLELFKNIRAN